MPDGTTSCHDGPLGSLVLSSPPAPYSCWQMPVELHRSGRKARGSTPHRRNPDVSPQTRCQHRKTVGECRRDYRVRASASPRTDGGSNPPPACRISRSEERRVGKECISQCRSRGSPTPTKKKQT